MTTKGKKMIVAVNEQGYRIGSSHHNCRLSDEIVDQIRDMHEDLGIGYRKIAKHFNLKRSTVQKICNYERRAQTPDRWKKVEAKD
jgi:DNA invertase Pin-like site-specific DNA recombinase